MMVRAFFLLIVAVAVVQAYLPSGARILGQRVSSSSTSLFAHHVQKKIIKRKQDRRPIKSRLSDINRTNVNLNKCITKVEGAPADYTMVSAEDYMKVREKALLFWENGSTSTEWLQITDEDMVLTLPQNIDPLPQGGVQKRPNLVRSGSC